MRSNRLSAFAHHRIFDPRDYLHRTATVFARFNINLKHARDRYGHDIETWRDGGMAGWRELFSDLGMTPVASRQCYQLPQPTGRRKIGLGSTTRDWPWASKLVLPIKRSPNVRTRPSRRYCGMSTDDVECCSLNLISSDLVQVKSDSTAGAPSPRGRSYRSSAGPVQYQASYR